MSRDSGAEQPTQRTVAELLAEYGNDDSGQRNARKRRRRAEDPTETAPQAIIDRVLSDSGKLRPIDPDAEPPQTRSHRPSPQPEQAPQPEQVPSAPAQPPQAPPGPVAPPPGPPAGSEADRAQQSGEQPAVPAAQAEGANYWAQRFASAGGSRGGAVDADADADTETTLQQPALPASPPPAPQAPAPPAQQVEGATVQLPPVELPAQPDQHGTTFLAPAAPAPDDDPQPDPYDYDLDNAFGDRSDDEYPGAARGGDAAYADDYDPELPAGIGSSELAEEEEPAPSAGREWGVLAVQVVGALVGGGVLWLGFRWLWAANAFAALAAALMVSACLVFVAWKVLRSNDLQTMLLAVLAGVLCTMSPAALLLINH
ncbi:hypothetical protein IQ251_10460 [Saccharopolyspora sp. HNM0983]|uniref:Transmembrane protein n=1 Tax=Saccharopolyspora montiporae TaxID=2781240 RepID=A0A929B7V5_9PSEU|nr:hypothetical protein [Saccharopolyspora sp. HNM0983]MBE9374864.1 hypothetical protein [Saccharopolyspora sp. HNM0983]